MARARMVGEAGIVMVEGMLGVMLLVFVTMAAIQMMLAASGVMTARQVVQHGARAYALDGCSREDTANREFDLIKATSAGGLYWSPLKLSCPPGGRAVAEVTVKIASVLPGAGVLVGGSITDPIQLTQKASYPLAGAA